MVCGVFGFFAGMAGMEIPSLAECQGILHNTLECCASCGCKVARLPCILWMRVCQSAKQCCRRAPSSTRMPEKPATATARESMEVDYNGSSVVAASKIFEVD